MTPTRELAAQVAAALQQMIPVPNIRTALLIGGEPMPRQFRQLQQKPRLIVGTPGRINDHLQRNTLRLSKTQFLVLDETDRMLDMGFGVQIDEILQHVPQENLQTMLFSATLPQEIVRLSSKYLKNPQRISVGSTTTPAAKIKQELVQTTDAEKYQQLLMQVNKRTGSIIIFVKTKFGADRLADKLSRADFEAEAIHGDLKQSRRDKVIRDFRDRKHRILVATDVAARGLDIPHIEHVINYDMPQCPEDYIHRIGRTARAGAEGEAVNLLTSADSIKWRAIQRLINPGEALPSHKEGGSSERSYKPRKGGKSFGDKPWGKKPFRKDGDRPNSFGGNRENRAPRPFSNDRPQGERQERSFSNDRPQNDRPQNDRPQGERAPRPSFGDRDGNRAPRPFNDRDGNRQAAPQRDRDGNRGPRPSFGDRPQGERAERSFSNDRPKGDRPQGDRPRGDRPYGDRPARPQGDRPYGERKQGGDFKRSDWKSDRNKAAPSGDRKSSWTPNDKPARSNESGEGRPAKPWVKREGGKPSFSKTGDAAPKRHYGDRMKKRGTTAA
jgi:superfamily II DNA/RNA helicase